MSKEKQARGIATRHEVMGPNYPAKAIEEFDSFTRPFQELVTAYCWDEIWNSHDLPRKTRSLINIALLTTLNRTPELRLHLFGALRNGCTEKEIQGVLLQCSVYAGVPAGSEGFRVAKEVIDEYRRTAKA